MISGKEFAEKYGASGGKIKIRQRTLPTTQAPATKNKTTKGTKTLQPPQPPQKQTSLLQEYEASEALEEFNRGNEGTDVGWFKDEIMDSILGDLRYALETGQLALGDTMIEGDQLVFGEGNIDSKIMVVGEAPGINEATSGRPFVGDSGKMVEALFKSYKLDLRKDTFVTNVVKIFPYTSYFNRGFTKRSPRQPTMNEIADYVTYLKRQIERVQPTHIFCFGKIAANVIVSGLDIKKLSKSKISGRLDCELFETIGKLQDNLHVVRFEGVRHQTKVICLYHPSYILRMDPGKRLETEINWKGAFAVGALSIKDRPVEIPKGFHSETLYKKGYKCPHDVKWTRPTDIIWQRPLPPGDYFKQVNHNEATNSSGQPRFSFEVTGLIYNESDDTQILFGRTPEGFSVRCNVEKFKYHFFTEIPMEFDFWNEDVSSRKHQDIPSAIKAMKAEVCKELGQEIGLKFEKHQDHYGYRCRYLPLKYYARFETATHKNISAVAGIARKLWGDTIRCYHVDGKPDFDFTYASKIKAYSWVEIPRHLCNVAWVGSKITNYCKENPVDLEISVVIGDIIVHSPMDTQWSHHAPMRYVSWDIECYSDRLGFPRPEDDPIICIAFELQLQNDSTVIDPKTGICKENVFVEFIIGDCEPLEEHHSEILCQFETEEDMLGSFCSLLRQCDPDVIDGYNSDRFDFWYLIRRAETLNLREKHGWIPFGRDDDRPVTVTDKVITTRAFGTRINRIVNIPGKASYDIMVDLMRNKKLRSYALAGVSQQFLGSTKNDMPYVSIRGYFFEDAKSRKKLLSYCKKDTHLVSRLRNFLKLIIAAMELSRQTGSVFLDKQNIEGQQIKVYSALRHKIEENGGRNIIMSHYKSKNRNFTGGGFGGGDSDDEEIVETYVVNGETNEKGNDLDDGSDTDEEGGTKLGEEDELANSQDEESGSDEYTDSEGDSDDDTKETSLSESCTRGKRANEKVTKSAPPTLGYKDASKNWLYQPKPLVGKKVLLPGVLPVVGSGKGIQSGISSWFAAKPIAKNNKKRKEFFGTADNPNIANTEETTEDDKKSENDCEKTTKGRKKKHRRRKKRVMRRRGAVVTKPQPRPRTGRPPEKKKKLAAYTGAVVIDPVIGLHRRPVICSDFASMYPSIMITHNLCHSTALFKCQVEKAGFSWGNWKEFLECPPEMFVHKGCQECGNKKHPVYFVKSEYLSIFFESDLPLQREEYALFGKNFDDLIEPLGIRGLHYYKWRNHKFSTPEEEEDKKEAMYRFKDTKMGLGMFPLALKDILSARSIAKNERDKYPPGSTGYGIFDQRQLALKIMANSGYGASGAKGGKLSEKRIGASVTAYGRDYITDCRDRSLEHFTSGLWEILTLERGSFIKKTECVGGDTDSWFFLPACVTTVAEAMEFGPRVVKYQNQHLRGAMSLAFEKVLLPFLVLKKKRYAGALYSGEFNNLFFEKLRWLELHVPQELWEKILSIKDWYKMDGVFFSEGIPWWNIPEGITPGSEGDTCCPFAKSWKLRLGAEYKRRDAQSDEEWIKDFKKPRYEGPLVHPPDYAILTSKGTEAVRRDASPFVKRLANTYLKMVLMEGRISDGIMYLYENIRALMDGKISECDLIMSKQISKTMDQYVGSTQAHIYLAKKMEARGEAPPDIGQRLSFMMTKPQENVVTVNSKGNTVFLRKLEAYKCSETPERIFVDQIDIDFHWYMESCRNAICRLVESTMSNPERILFNFDRDTLFKATKKLIKPPGDGCAGGVSTSSSFIKFVHFEDICKVCGGKYLSKDPCGICEDCLIVSNSHSLSRLSLKEKASLTRAQQVYDKQMAICRDCTKLEDAPCNNSHCGYFPVRMKLFGVVKRRSEKLEKLLSTINPVLSQINDDPMETDEHIGSHIANKFPHARSDKQRDRVHYVRSFDNLVKGLSVLSKRKLHSPGGDEAKNPCKKNKMEQ